jgi:hypothetical protein
MVVTPLELDAVIVRAMAATPGPWTWWCCDEESGVCQIDEILTVYTSEGDYIGPADAEFIAHAREDIPALVAEVRRLQSRIAELEGGETIWSWKVAADRPDVPGVLGPEDGKDVS